MKKRGIFLLVAAMLSLFFLAACDSAKPAEKTEYTTYTDPVMGISIDLPQKELTSRTLSYSQMDLSGKTGNFIPKDGTSLVFQPEKSAVSLFVLQYYDEMNGTPGNRRATLPMKLPASPVRRSWEERAVWCMFTRLPRPMRLGWMTTPRKSISVF